MNWRVEFNIGPKLRPATGTERYWSDMDIGAEETDTDRKVLRSVCTCTILCNEMWSGGPVWVVKHCSA